MISSELPIPRLRERWAQRKYKIVRFFVREKFWRRFPVSSSRNTQAVGRPTNYFLRGFNLDHGTDFAIFIDDMPLNLPSHAHGEGYADMNTVIPEFVKRVNYEKGPFMRMWATTARLDRPIWNFLRLCLGTSSG